MEMCPDGVCVVGGGGGGVRETFNLTIPPVFSLG